MDGKELISKKFQKEGYKGEANGETIGLENGETIGVSLRRMVKNTILHCLRERTKKG